MDSRRVFLAGATGAVGRTIIGLPADSRVRLVSHLRPGREVSGFPEPAVCALDRPDELDPAMRGCTTVLQLIGSRRARFARGDTYETSDVGTTRQLVEAARRVGTVDHFVLLSSVGAGRPMGAYLEAKARAEALVRESGLRFTIVRPSTFVGGGHKAPPGFSAVTKLFGLKALQPIAIEDLARMLLRICAQRAPENTVLEGASLWAEVEEARTR
jgi:nucleoside-diphosphate-sugar epimerase